MNLEEAEKILEFACYVITILGVPGAILVYFWERRKDRKAREAETYNAMDEKYQEFLRLCLEHPFLNIYDDENASFTRYSKEEQAKAMILFDILVSIFERAYVMYKDHNDTIRKAQWEGWDLFINCWMKRQDFRVCWEKYLRTQWEINFSGYMDQLYEINKPVEGSKSRAPVHHKSAI